MDQWLVFSYFMIGGGLAIPLVYFLYEPLKIKMAQAERREARELYRQIVADKLDVIKTAIAMGHSGDELEKLDKRLEKLIGRDDLKGLLSTKKVPLAPDVDPDSDLMDADLVTEIEREKQRERERSED